MATAPTRDVARWRVGLFKVLAALFVVFQLFNIGNLMAPWNADPALAPTGLAAPDTHLWHAALPGAVRLLLTGGVAAALLFRPASKPLLVQWLILSAAVTVVVVVPFAGLPPLLFIVLPTVLVVAAYPWPSKLANLRVAVWTGRSPPSPPWPPPRSLPASGRTSPGSWTTPAANTPRRHTGPWTPPTSSSCLPPARWPAPAGRAGKPLPSSPASPSSTSESPPSPSRSRLEAGAPWEERWA
jgi:hypothetical protein